MPLWYSLDILEHTGGVRCQKIAARLQSWSKPDVAYELAVPLYGSNANECHYNSEGKRTEDLAQEGASFEA